MLPDTNIDLEAPGLAFAALIELQKPRNARRFISEDMLEILEGLEPGFTNSEQVKTLARKILEPVEVLEARATRHLALELLPQRKARELSTRLGVDPGRDPFSAVIAVADDVEKLPEIFSFFGVVDEPRAPMAQLPGNDVARAAYPLFPHQRRAAERTKLMLSRTPHRGVLHMPTGAGKTRTGMHLVASHLVQEGPSLVIWFTQNVELLDQAADEFTKAWSFLGDRELQLFRFWGNKRVDLDAAKDGFFVAGLSKMAALSKRSPNDILKIADRASLVVIDEAHQAIAPTYRNVLDALATKRVSTKLLGLTATPGRTWSDIELDEALSTFFAGQKVMLDVEGHPDPVSYLMEAEYLAEPEFKRLNTTSGLELDVGSAAKLTASIDVPDKVLDDLGQSTQRNLSIIGMCEELATRHSRIIVFAPSVANAKILAAVMIARGVESLVVTGETDPGIRERIIRRFKSNESGPIIMFNFGVLTTGFDAPKTSAAIIARPTKSLVLYSQMVGRATRGLKAGGNANAEIITVTDTDLPGFGDVSEAFANWEDVWSGPSD